MKDEEMAEEYYYKTYPVTLDVGEEERKKEVTDIYLAGLKARPQWHDLWKDKNDLPKDKHDVWCKALDHYGEGWYDKDTNTWTLIYRGYLLHCIEAWCELPTFDKE